MKTIVFVIENSVGVYNNRLDGRTDDWTENQDGGVGRHTVPPRTTRTDRESNGKGVRHQGNKKMNIHPDR